MPVTIKKLMLLSLFLLTGGCVQIDPVLTAQAAPIAEKLLAAVSRQPVRLAFFNRLSDDRTVPMVPSMIESLSFDDVFIRQASDYKSNEGVQEVLPFIEPGEHFVKLTFKQQVEPVTIPVIVPENSKSKTHIMILIGKYAQSVSIKVGYDFDNNQEIDRDQVYWQSQDGQTYFEYQPNGTVQEWKSKLTQSHSDRLITDPNSQALPPGADSIKPAPGQRLPRTEKEHRPPPIDVPQIPQQKPVPLTRR